MSRSPAVCLAVAVAVISVQAALASPAASPFDRLEVRCHESPERALAAAGASRVTADWPGPDALCLWGRLHRAIEAALARIEPLAAERALPCDARCWLDRPTSAIARIDPDVERIWPRPPNLDRLTREGWVVFIVIVPDLAEGWWWIAVSSPDRAGRVEVEVVDG